MVNKAGTLIDKDGKAAFAEFRKKDSAWFHGDTYLFAYDMKANVLLNPAFPQREGTNVTRRANCYTGRSLIPRKPKDRMG